jgi:hypothetical protein
MKPGVAAAFALALFGLGMALVGCEQMPTGPSLSNVVVQGFTKQPTIDSRDPSLCCCRAVGTVTNRNAVPIYVTITLTAFDARGNAISKVLFFVPDVAPGQTAPVVAPGFPVPCNAIDHFTPEVKVRGLTEPPL